MRNRKLVLAPICLMIVSGCGDEKVVVHGSFQLALGAVGGGIPVTGGVNFDDGQHKVTVQVTSKDGLFTVALRPGLYRIEGSTVSFGGGGGGCFGQSQPAATRTPDGRVPIDEHHTEVEVVCQGR
jgi:hypothetical protein